MVWIISRIIDMGRLGDVSGMTFGVGCYQGSTKRRSGYTLLALNPLSSKLNSSFLCVARKPTLAKPLQRSCSFPGGSRHGLSIQKLRIQNYDVMSIVFSCFHLLRIYIL